MIAIRLVLPWLAVPRHGSIAADTTYYPFGTRMYVPGYGWGVVQDQGSNVQGPDRIDLFHRNHGAAQVWGRRRLEVTIESSR